jgi:Na+/phosphate symporter
VFVLVLAVPALLVVVLGYVVGYAVWAQLVGPDDAEGAGWLTGLLLLAGTTLLAVRLLRAARRDRR